MTSRVEYLESLINQLQDQMGGLMQKLAAVEGSLWQNWTDTGPAPTGGSGGGFVGVVTTAITAMNFTSGVMGSGVITVQKNASGSLTNVTTGQSVFFAQNVGIVVGATVFGAIDKNGDYYVYGAGKCTDYV